MPRVIPLDDPDDPRLADYLNQRDAHLRARHLAPDAPDATGTGMPGGLFMAEGRLVLSRLVRASRTGRPTYGVRSLLVRPETLPQIEEDLALLDEGVPVYTADRRIMNRIVGFDIHRGILAVGEVRRPPAVDELLASARTIVALEDSANHDNVGSIFRSCSCLAHDPPERPAAVLLSPRSCDPLYRKSLRVSMGHALEVPFATLEPWPDGLENVRRAGFEVVGLTPAEGAESLDVIAAEPPRRRCLLLGAEGPGLTPAALARADRRVTIPMRPGADSLNLAVSAAIALHRLGPGGVG